MAAPARATPSLSPPLSGVGEPEVCSICLDLRHSDDIDTQQELVTLRCRHVFHSACIQAWMAKHSTCPLCRIPRNNALAVHKLPAEDPARSASSASSSASSSTSSSSEEEEEENEDYKLPTEDLARSASSASENEDYETLVPIVRQIRPRLSVLAPSRPLTAYLIFCNVLRPELREQHPDLSFSAMGYLLSQQWRDLPEDR